MNKEGKDETKHTPQLFFGTGQLRWYRMAGRYAASHTARSQDPQNPCGANMTGCVEPGPSKLRICHGYH